MKKYINKPKLQLCILLVMLVLIGKLIAKNEFAFVAKLKVENEIKKK